MATTTPQKAVAPGTSAQIVLPQGGQQFGWLVLDNLSTFLLQVVVGANVFYHDPLVTARYSLEGVTNPVTVTAILVPPDTSTTGTVAPTWYGFDEPPIGNYPIALSGPAEVAAATAAALLAGGIPNVITVTPLPASPLHLAGAPTSAVIDVHSYAALYATAAVTLAGTQNRGILLTFQLDAVNPLSQIVNQFMLPADLDVANYTAQARIPVDAPYLVAQIALGGAGDTATLNLSGTNRAIPKLETAVYGTTAATFTAAGAITAGTRFPIVGQLLGQSGQPTGDVAITVSLDDPQVSGTLTIEYADGWGHRVEQVVLDTADLDYLPVADVEALTRIGTARTIIPPTGSYTFNLYPRTSSTGNANVQISVAPAEAA